jgi:uncharacterized protein YrzB (UPF0473 family)
MKTKYWEREKVYVIQKDIQKMIDDKEVKTIISFSLTAQEDKHGFNSVHSAILIYK